MFSSFLMELGKCLTICFRSYVVWNWIFRKLTIFSVKSYDKNVYFSRFSLVLQDGLFPYGRTKIIPRSFSNERVFTLNEELARWNNPEPGGPRYLLSLDNQPEHVQLACPTRSNCTRRHIPLNLNGTCMFAKWMMRLRKVLIAWIQTGRRNINCKNTIEQWLN